jgi:D-alanine-D-alanine ligase
VRPKIVVIYNQPDYSRCSTDEEAKAEVSIVDTVRAVYRALAEAEYPVTKISLQPPLDKARDKLKSLQSDQVVFNLFEGFDGHPETEAEIVNALAELGIIYTGCNADTLSLALDKVKTKTILEAAGIDTPSCQLLGPETLTEFKLNYPCIVKPAGEDASHGLTEESVVFDSNQLEKQVSKISRLFGGRALVEEFVGGRELNVTIIGNKEPSVLPITEIVYSLPPGMPQILTFAAKWDKESTYFQCTRPVCPAEISTELRNRIEKTAISVFKILNCSGYARLDFRLDGDERIRVLEFNPNPDITPGNGAARQAKMAGMTYKQFIEKVVLLALERHRDVSPYSLHDWQGQASHTANLKEYA